MENKSDEIYVRIEDPSIGTRSIVLMSLTFSIGFLVCIAVGATGPQIFSTKMASNGFLTLHQNTSYTTWQTSITDMVPLHRQFYIMAKIQHPGYFSNSGPVSSFSYNQAVTISLNATHQADNKEAVLYKPFTKDIQVTCGASNMWCNTIILLYIPIIQFSDYDLKVVFQHPKIYNGDIGMEISLMYENTKYSVFSAGWSYFFLGITILVMFFPCCGFFWAAAKIPTSKWTNQQKWVAGLLCTLFFYDDPFLAAELKTTNSGLAFAYVFFMATFLATILLFWLCIIDDVRYDSHGNSHEAEERKIPRWFIPKLLLCFAIWIVLMGAFLTAKRRQHIDPAYDPSQTRDSYPYYISTAVFMVIYILWILYLLVSCFHHVKSMIPGYRFLFFVTLVTIIVTIIGVFLVAFYPLRGAPIGLLSIFGLYNLYVWTLALAYTPFDRGSVLSRTTDSHHLQHSGSLDIKSINFQEDDEEGTRV